MSHLIRMTAINNTQPNSLQADTDVVELKANDTQTGIPVQQHRILDFLQLGAQENWNFGPTSSSELEFQSRPVELGHERF